jgi:SAM-dependent methyltransferase
VTPEIAAMQWPNGTRLLALDLSLAMLETVWPGHRMAGAVAACADWTQMPAADKAFEVATGDGFYSMVCHPEGYQAITRELRRVLRDNGLLALRAFIRPVQTEPVAAICDDLLAGRIGNFHIFKWRLNMAVHGDLAAGVRLADIWNAWNEVFPEPAVLADKLNWPLETIRTIDAYRGVQTRYTYPTLEELRHTLAVHFRETACVYPAYELGDRCPTLLFAPR